MRLKLERIKYVYILFCLDYRKLEEWRTIIADDLTSLTWYDSSDSSSDSKCTDDSSTSEDENERMDID